MKAENVYDRKWITENSVEILTEYSGGITIRQLHYRLVAAGMTNDNLHYKKVVAAMTASRWKGDIQMTSFIDRERAMCGETKSEEKSLSNEIEKGKEQIQAWMNAYGLNRWANQKYYIEVWIEKKALQGVFEFPCLTWGVGLAPCKGYPSLTFLNEACERFLEAESKEKELVILYFGDYDPSGEDIPRSIGKNLNRLGVEVEVNPIALNASQISSMKLAGVPPKAGDSRTKNWTGGKVVECDAVEPKKLAQMCERAIQEYFDGDLFSELEERERIEKSEYRKSLKTFVRNIK